MSRDPARDWAIWQAVAVDKRTHADVAAEYGLSGTRIGQIVEAMRGNMSVRARADVRADFAAELERLRAVVQEVMDLKPAPVVKSEGGAIVYVKDPETGEYVRDHGARLSAVAAALKVQERAAKMLGVDAPQETVAETHVTYEIRGADPDAL